MQDCTLNFCGRQRLFSSRKGHCSFHDSSRLRMEKREQDKRTAKRRALSAARDELVRAAVALNAAHSDIALAAPVDPTSAVVSRRLAWSDFRAAVAAYEKLAGGA